MARPYWWLGVWDYQSSSWKPLGYRRSFPATAALAAPAVARLNPGVVHLGTVVCRSPSAEEAEAAFAKLPPPAAVGGDPIRVRH